MKNNLVLKVVIGALIVIVVGLVVTLVMVMIRPEVQTIVTETTTTTTTILPIIIERWKTYENAQYGFEIKYPSSAEEIKPNLSYGDKWLLEVLIGRNFEIHILENTNKKTDIANLRNVIMDYEGIYTQPLSFPYHPTDPTNLNRPGPKITEFSIDSYPAIKSNYVAASEGIDKLQAVSIFTLSPKYIYKIDYAGNIQEGDQILSTFTTTMQDCDTTCKLKGYQSGYCDGSGNVSAQCSVSGTIEIGATTGCRKSRDPSQPIMQGEPTCCCKPAI
jgi:hypothetical protein